MYETAVLKLKAGCCIKCSHNCDTQATPSRKKDETNGSLKFLQSYPVVAVDALLEIGTAVVLSVLWLG
jgi:hypothetical protein